MKAPCPALDSSNNAVWNGSPADGAGGSPHPRDAAARRRRDRARPRGRRSARRRRCPDEVAGPVSCFAALDTDSSAPSASGRCVSAVASVLSTASKRLLLGDRPRLLRGAGTTRAAGPVALRRVCAQRAVATRSSLDPTRRTHARRRPFRHRACLRRAAPTPRRRRRAAARRSWCSAPASSSRRPAAIRCSSACAASRSSSSKLHECRCVRAARRSASMVAAA